ncbi:MAG: hypothetical protein JXB88_12765 [Spirochaetales bacterium]|nr:hypothetical protein [Spirochaetales bacterium]
MEWRIVYLIFSIISLVFGIWNLAQRKTFTLTLLSILWFIIVLFQFFIRDLYLVRILPGLVLGDLLTFIGLPALLIIGFLSNRFRK